MTRCFADTTKKANNKLIDQKTRFSLKDIKYFMFQDKKTLKTVLSQKQRSGRPYSFNKSNTITPWAKNLVKPKLFNTLTTTQQSFFNNEMFIEDQNSKK